MLSSQVANSTAAEESLRRELDVAKTTTSSQLAQCAKSLATITAALLPPPPVAVPPPVPPAADLQAALRALPAADLRAALGTLSAADLQAALRAAFRRAARSVPLDDLGGENALATLFEE